MICVPTPALPTSIPDLKSLSAPGGQPLVHKVLDLPVGFGRARGEKDRDLPAPGQEGPLSFSLGKPLPETADEKRAVRPCVRPTWPPPSPHLKRDTRACEAAVGAGGPLSALPLSPSGSGPFGAFFPGRNWDKIKGRTPKGYPSAPNTPDPQRGPVVPPTAAVLTVWYQTGCSSFERIGRRQRIAGRFQGGQNWYRKEDRKCWKNE